MERIVRCNVHRLVIVDENCRVEGIISLSDIVVFIVLRQEELLNQETKQQQQQSRDHTLDDIASTAENHDSSPAASAGVNADEPQTDDASLPISTQTLTARKPPPPPPPSPPPPPPSSSSSPFSTTTTAA